MLDNGPRPQTGNTGHVTRQGMKQATSMIGRDPLDVAGHCMDSYIQQSVLEQGVGLVSPCYGTTSYCVESSAAPADSLVGVSYKRNFLAH